MSENKKKCGHPPNPEDDVDSQGKPYDSCFQCFMEDYEKQISNFDAWNKAMQERK